MKIYIYLTLSIIVILLLIAPIHVLADSMSPTPTLPVPQGFDPLGIKNLFNFEAWGESIHQILAPTGSILSFIFSIFSFDLRDALVHLVFGPLGHKLFHTSTDIIDSPGFANLYRFFTRMSMAFVLLIFVFNAFKLIFNRESTNVTILIFKTGLGLAYLSAVPWLIKGVIWINNMLCDAAITFVGGKGVFAPLMSPQYDKTYMLIFVLVYCVFAIRLVFYYYARDYLITMLVLFAPFMWFMWLDEDLKKNTSIWLRSLITLIFTQFVHSIQLTIFTVVILGSGGGTETFWGDINNAIFSIIAMTYMVKTPAFLKEFTYEVSSGSAASAAKEVAKYLTFGKERALLSKLFRK